MNINTTIALCLLLISSCTISIGSQHSTTRNESMAKSATKPNYGALVTEKARSNIIAQPALPSEKESAQCSKNCLIVALSSVVAIAYIGTVALKDPIYDCQTTTISQCGACGSSSVECMPSANSGWQGARGTGSYVETEIDYIRSHCPDAKLSHQKAQCSTPCKDKSALSYLEKCTPQKAQQNSSAHRLRAKIESLQKQRRPQS